MTLVVKVLGIGLAGVATVAIGTTSYLLLSSSSINLKGTEDFKKYCYKLTEFSKDNSDNSKFQLLACQADTKTDSVSFYLYQAGTAGTSGTDGSFKEVKSVVPATGSSQVTVHLFKNGSSGNESHQLNIQGQGWNNMGWRLDSKLNNSTLKDICKVNWSGSDRDKKLTCRVGEEKIESQTSFSWQKFNAQ